MNLQQGQLDITVGAPEEFMNKTKGLLGIFNDNSADDLLPRDTTVHLTSSASEKVIFDQFGNTCWY